MNRIHAVSCVHAIRPTEADATLRMVPNTALTEAIAAASPILTNLRSIFDILEQKEIDYKELLLTQHRPDGGPRSHSCIRKPIPPPQADKDNEAL